MACFQIGEELMLKHSIQVALLIASSILFLSCGGLGDIILKISTQIVDDADYRLDSVTVSGPGQLSPNTQANYTVNFTFTVLNNGGMVSPFVVLGDDDGGLRFSNDLLVMEQHSEPAPGLGTFTRSMTLTLRCNNDILEGVAGQFGDSGSSGEGDFEVFQVDEAEVFARVQRGKNPPSQAVDSQVMDVACE